MWWGGGGQEEEHEEVTYFQTKPAKLDLTSDIPSEE